MYVTKEEYNAFERVKSEYGFLSQTDLRILSKHKELSLVWCIVRCGCIRPLVMIRDAEALIDIITREGSDHVRDIALTTEWLDHLRKINFQIKE